MWGRLIWTQIKTSQFISGSQEKEEAGSIGSLNHINYCADPLIRIKMISSGQGNSPTTSKENENKEDPSKN